MFSKIVVFSSCVALAVNAAPAPAAAPQPIAISRHSNHYEPHANGEVDGPRLMRSLDRTLRKYGVDSEIILEKRAVAEEALADQVVQGVDEEYYGNVNVGATNPQTFTVDFDTGSADFFVPGPSCGTSQGCVGTTKYDQKGQDEGNTTSITYGSGMVEGENYYDTVCVAGLCASHTNVISLTQASGFSSSASEGLMGMGFQAIAKSKQPTFFQNLMSQGKVSSPEFGFYLGRGKSNTQSRSELTLGGADSSRYSGTPQAHKVTKQGYWQIAIQGVSVNGKTAANTAAQAAIDTGTTIILAPTAAANAIFAQIPGAYPLPLVSGSAAETLYAYPCNTPASALPQLIFDGTHYTINPLDFNLGSAGSSLSTIIPGIIFGSTGKHCIAAIAGANISPNSPLYVVGDTFLKSHYSIYSYANGATVSFANAN